jgi:diguanylate cyclase (GGDEF)-like protein
MLAVKESDSPPGKRTSGAPRLVAVRALQIVQAASAEDANIEDLTRMALGDPAFSLKLLALANSPAFGGQRVYSDVKQAAVRLGLRGLSSVGISLLVSDMVPAGSVGDSLLVLALRRALAARWVATELKLSDVDKYFSLGLMLELGVFSHAVTNVDLAGRLAQLPALHRPLYEEVQGLKPHPVAGSELAERFHLPKEMADAIRHHHDVEPPKETAALVAWVAERMAAVFESGPAELAKQELLAHCQLLKLDPARLVQCLEQLPEQVRATATSFDRNLAPQSSLEQLRSDATARLLELNQSLEETVGLLRRVVEQKESLSQQLESANKQLLTLNQMLTHEAATDPLSGLANRRSLERELERELSRVRRNGTQLGLLMLDIDHFKRFNDTYGHLAGDEVIKNVGGKLAAALRRGDFVARFGGEEFCVLLPDTDSPGAVLVARRIRIAVERMELQYNGQSLKVTTSIGVTTIEPGAAIERDELIACADAALYKAKAEGRNRVVCFSPAEMANASPAVAASG